MSTGEVVQIIGAVVDVEFPRQSIPKIYDALRIEDADLTLEVQQQLGDGVVRTIAMGSSDGLRRGAKVENTGHPISVPVGPKTLGRIMNVLGDPVDEAGEPVFHHSVRTWKEATTDGERWRWALDQVKEYDPNRLNQANNARHDGFHKGPAACRSPHCNPISRPPSQ